MAFKFIKTVNGRKYRYERISTTRSGNQVLTKDKCLGPLDPVVRGKIENAPAEARQRLIAHFKSPATLPEMVRWFKDDSGISVSERTITNYMNRHGIKRGFVVAVDMSDHMKRVHAEKRQEKVSQEKQARAHLKILVGEKVIKPADSLEYVRGQVDVAAVEAVWAKHQKQVEKKRSR